MDDVSSETLCFHFITNFKNIVWFIKIIIIINIIIIIIIIIIIFFSLSFE